MENRILIMPEDLRHTRNLINKDFDEQIEAMNMSNKIILYIWIPTKI